MSQYIDYQQRAREYSVGDSAVPYGMSRDFSGRVTAVWPAIGMVEVEFPIGNRTVPVEQLQKLDTWGVVAPFTNSSPVSGQRVSVPGAPNPIKVASEFKNKSSAGKSHKPSRLVSGKTADLEDACWDDYEAVGMKEKDGEKVPNCVPTKKEALYWAGKDRRYRMDRGESTNGKPCCPRCDGIVLRPAIYKRRDGSSDKLLGCSGCLFLIKEIDIINLGGK